MYEVLLRGKKTQLIGVDQSTKSKSDRAGPGQENSSSMAMCQYRPNRHLGWFFTVA